MFKFKLSWFGFVLFNSILITLLNFNLHSFVYEKLSQITAYFSFYRSLFWFGSYDFSLIFVKYLTKILSIFFILSSCTSLYFITFYGVLIDSDMIQNVMQTDIKEVKDLLSWRLVLLAIVVLLFVFLF